LTRSEIAIPGAILIGSVVIGAAVVGAQLFAPYRLSVEGGEHGHVWRLNVVTGEAVSCPFNATSVTITHEGTQIPWVKVICDFDAK